MKKSVSDETFSTSYLSSSTVSTPVGMNGRVKKRKRKLNRVIVGDNSVLLSGMLYVLPLFFHCIYSRGNEW